MRVACRLRDLRGDRSLRDIADLVGVSAGLLSEIERGIRFPRDADVPALERTYGAPAAAWYAEDAQPITTLALISDDEDRS